MDKKKILIYGAGAIGRGFLAPIFYRLGYNIYFVDKNPEIVNELKKRKQYQTAFVKNNDYYLSKVEYSSAFILGEEDSIIDNADFVFSCVGPGNIIDFAGKLKNAKTIISFENEAESVDKIKKLSKNNNCYFGIPDVIASNSCSPELKEIDSLCLISECGNIAIEKGSFELPEQIRTYKKKDLEMYWNCKFYLHNTPHAAAAFLGKLFNCKYLHEAMKIPIIESIVKSVMDSMKNAMKIKGLAKEEFIDFYAKKELKRFKDELLFDPISRVSREPLRKLRENDRLIKSARFIEETGQDLNGICLVIKAAVYDAIANNYSDSFQILKEKPTEKSILKNISGLKENEKLMNIILSQKPIFPVLIQN